MVREHSTNIALIAATIAVAVGCGQPAPHESVDAGSSTDGGPADARPDAVTGTSFHDSRPPSPWDAATADADVVAPDAAAADADVVVPDAAEADADVVAPDAAAADADVVAPDAAVVVNPPDLFDGVTIDLLAGNTTTWQLLYPERAAAITIADGHLNITARNPDETSDRNGWYQDDHGPLVYKNVTGDFAVAARLRVVDATTPSAPPTGSFNAGGFVIRDPAGTHNGDEHWVMYNMGTNNGAYQREIKKTASSLSGLYLNPQVFEEQVLVVCRVAGAFHFFHWDSTGQQWVAERYQPGTTVNLSQVVPEVDTSGTDPMTFTDALPDQIQLGVMAHAWATQPGDTTRTLASYDWIAFSASPPINPAECTSGFAGLSLP